MQSMISVIIPVYNVDRYLRQCLDSVINQTYKNLEIILVDDGSTDNSGKICDEYALKDNRIKVIHKQNGGLSDARNTGLKYVSGEFCHFLDSDDYIDYHLYEQSIKVFDNFKVDYFCFSSKSFFEKGSDVYNKKDIDEYIFVKRQGIYGVNINIGLNTNIHVWNKIFKTEIINKNNLHFIKGLLYEDIFFVWSYIFLSKKAYFSKEYFHNYRIRNDSIMGKTIKNKMLKTGIDHMLNWYELFKSFSNNKKSFITNYNSLFYLLNIYYDTTKKMVPKKDYMYIEELKNKYLLEINNCKNKYCNIFNKLYFKIEKIWYFLLLKDVFNLNKWKSKFRYYKQKIITAVYFRLQIFFMRFCKNNNFDNRILEIETKKDTNNKIICDELQKINNFYFLPNRGNLGDMAIATACYKFFDLLNLEYNVIDMTKYEQYIELPVNIVYGGGGLFTKYYRQYYQEILEIFKSKKLQKVIVLPASFYECDDVLEVFDERFTVFCREKQSYNYCLSKNNKAQFILADDMALSLNVKFTESKTKICNNVVKISQSQKKELKKLYKYYTCIVCKYNGALRKSNNIGCFFRTDKEAIIDENKRKISLIDLSLIANSFCADKSFTYIMIKLFFKVLNSYGFIVTDRLHIGICAALLNKKVYILDNKYKKLSNVLENSMSKYPNVKLYNNISELINEIDKFNSSNKKNKARINILSFNEFVNEWKSVKQNFEI